MGEADLAAELLLALRGHDAWQDRRHTVAQPNGLSLFLRHAAVTVPYYRSLFRDATRSNPILENFPPISRFDLATRRLEFLPQTLLADGHNLFVKTSGVTAEPLTVFLDLASWYDLSHSTFATVTQSVPGLLAKMAPGQAGVVLITNEANRRQNSLVLLKLKCALFERRILGMSKAADRTLLAELRGKLIPLLYGKPSYLAGLAELDCSTRRRHASIVPSAILVSGENLFPDTRRHLEKWFGCRVYNAYTSAEGGLIALECEQGTGLHVQTSRVKLEVLAADGTLNSTGVGEVLLTNLFNWAMPIVRYRTGDQAEIHNTCGCGHRGATIVALPGREAIQFNTARGPVVPQTLDGALASAEVKQFQLTQAGVSKFVLRWVPASYAVDVAHREQELLAGLRRKLGNIAVEIMAVPAITKKGAKVRRYIASAGVDVPTKRAASVGRTREDIQLRHAGKICAVAFSPDGRTVASAGGLRAQQGDVQLWDTVNGAKVADIDQAAVLFRCVAYSINGQSLAWGGDDGLVKIRVLTTGADTKVISAHASPVLGVALSPNGRLLASAGQDCMVRLWEVASGKKVAILGGHRSSVCSLAFSPNGGLLVSGSSDHTLRLWNVETYAKAVVGRSPCGIASVSFSPDGDTIATGGRDGIVRLWDVATGLLLAIYHGHTGPVSAVAFSPDAKSLASGSVDRTVKLWHFWTGGVLATIDGHEGAVTCLSFSPDGTVLASGSAVGVLKLSPVTPAPQL